MNLIKKYIILLKRILLNIRREHIGAFAAQSAFFFMMSFFPLMFLISTIMEVSQNGAESIFAFSTLFTAWSAGKGFYALAEGFHSILSIHEKRNYIVLRIRGLFCSVAFAIIIAALFFIGVFGGTIWHNITNLYPGYGVYTSLFSVLRGLFIVFVLFVILSLIYNFLPDWSSYEDCGGSDIKRRFHCISAFSASLSIYLYTVIFSFYTDIFMENTATYGGFSALVPVMLWVYGSMYIIILGFRLSVYMNMIYQKRACCIKIKE